jgi:hypothetical protein
MRACCLRGVTGVIMGPMQTVRLVVVVPRADGWGGKRVGRRERVAMRLGGRYGRRRKLRVQGRKTRHISWRRAGEPVV